ncbi:AAA family ATPase [Phytohabitans flavus]|uniref:AAA family ATPase n=1 Tax=Phytohabitans flavus TaxID=1076124 RepID=UPI00364330A6
MAAKRPPYLLRLKVGNFRSLRDVEVHLGPLNVLVGPNGSGKSNLLDVIAFLGDAVRTDLAPALDARGGFDRVRFRGTRSSPSISIEAEASVTKNSGAGATDDYSLTVTRGRSTQRPELRRQERFEFNRPAGQDQQIVVNGGHITFTRKGDRTASLREGALGLASLPKLLEPEEGGDQVLELAELFASVRLFDIDVASARLPSRERYSRTLAPNASNLAAFLAYIHEEHPDRFQALGDDARAFIPGLEVLEFVPVGGAAEGMVLNLAERGLSGSTTLGEASYGSVRALALLALLYDPSPPRLTCIEEIDHGLHPHILDRLVDLLREASSRTQFLIATHSPALVNRLSPDELIVCERGENAASRIPAIEPRLVREMERELRGEVGLGELWFTGALGGVP